MKWKIYFKATFLMLMAVSFSWSVLMAQDSPDEHAGQIDNTSGELPTKSIDVNVEKEKPGSIKDNLNTLDWTILETYAIEENASGLAYDGEYLYFGIYGADGDRIYRFDPSTGDYELHLNAPIEDALGLTYDGTYLWTIKQGDGISDPSFALQFDMDGNEMDQFDLPDHYMSGIAYDEGDFWSSTYYDPDGHIYKTDDAGNILDDFSAPDEQPWDLTVEGENLWMVDYWGYAIYKIDKATGDLLESYDSEHDDPAGITWDGQYLWYLDAGTGNEQDLLYKVDPYGSGAPAINLPFTSHNYGLVNVGASETWDMTVENTGEVDLIVEDVQIPDSEVTTSASFPITIEPGNETTIPLTYAPEDFGELETIATVVSNDPLNSEVEVELTGNGVYEGPTSGVADDSHDYGTVRVAATTRWYLEVINEGDEILTVEEISIDNEDFYIEPSIEFPVDISVLGKKDIGIWFNPQEDTDYSVTLTVTTNDPTTPNLFVDLSGSGDAAPYEVGEQLWNYNITTGYDNSAIAFTYLPDLNNDNRHEAIVADDDNYVRCLNGNSHDYADVLWEKELPSGVYHEHNLVRAPDLNGDDFEDLVVGTTGGDRSVRALSGKDGSNIWQYNTDEYGSGGWVYQVFAKYDYNDDNMTDILAATGDDGDGTGPKRVFCIDGSNGEVIWEKYAGGPAFSVIGIPDFNDDGQPDVLAGASNESETQGKVMGIDGATGNVEWTYNTSGSSVWALEILSDINDDNVADVIAGDFNGGYYLLDATDGSVIETGGLGNDIITWFDRVGDVNGDGYRDIAPAHSGANMVVIDGKTGDYVWSNTLADQCSHLTVMEDINGDLVKEIAVGTLFQDNVMYIIDGSNGDELMSKTYGAPVDGVGAIPDVVGDGSWEALAGGRDGYVSCFSGGIGLTTHVPSVVENSKMNHEAAPNPFSRSTTISFVLDHPRDVTIDILDMKGVKITTLASRHFDGGIHKIQWNANVAPGVYFYRIHTGSNVHTGKVVVE
ncbi:MAG: PQQ-binding-like beta-propeller repeat protein [Bacteroidales bacterium]|nr:PQQ-binding-like beta-propeller repeat protein [Bacteroidales bacterium]MCF8333165.1 PQQ-binding-like beta-propeller repeat protein [Bacteroidales bacterium]